MFFKVMVWFTLNFYFHDWILANVQNFCLVLKIFYTKQKITFLISLKIFHSTLTFLTLYIHVIMALLHNYQVL